MRFLGKSVLAATIAVLAPAPLVHADTFSITVSAGHGPQLPWIRMLKDFYMPEVDKRLKEAGAKHTIAWKEAFSGTLAKIGGELAAIEEGIAEMGWVYTCTRSSSRPSCRCIRSPSWRRSAATMPSR
jgi:TRAP-type transport system periplasmic protein